MKRFLAIICIVGMLLIAGNVIAYNDYQTPAKFMYAETYGVDYENLDLNFTNYLVWFPEGYDYFFGLMPITELPGYYSHNEPSYESENWYTAGSVFVNILSRN